MEEKPIGDLTLEELTDLRSKYFFDKTSKGQTMFLIYDLEWRSRLGLSIQEPGCPELRITDYVNLGTIQ